MNMSYCRFQNTVIDLVDCLRAPDRDLQRNRRAQNDLHPLTGLKERIR